MPSQRELMITYLLTSQGQVWQRCLHINIYDEIHADDTPHPNAEPNGNPIIPADRMMNTHEQNKQAHDANSCMAHRCQLHLNKGQGRC